MFRSAVRRALSGAIALSVAAISVSCSDDSPRDVSPTASVAENTSLDDVQPTEPLQPSTQPSTVTTATTAADASTVPRDTAAPATDRSELTGAGIEVVETEEDIAASTDEGAIVLTAVQADRLLADVDPASGVLGSDLDQLAPLPAESPPMSFLVAAWVTVGESAGAAAARTWMGEQDWQNAPQVRFPGAVLTLFVDDVAALVGDSAPLDQDRITFDLPATGGRAIASGFAPSAAAQDGACVVVQNTINQFFARVVQVLRIPPVEGGGIFGDLANGFVFIFNTAVGLAARLVQGLVETITKPVFDAIRLGIATLGIATQFTSYLRNEKVTVLLAEPPAPGRYRFAVGAEADIPGEFVAEARSLTEGWPPFLKSCATDLGIALPEVVGAGTPTSWAIEQPVKQVISQLDPNTDVDADRRARMQFTTGRESEEDARGDATSSGAIVTVRIPRTDVDRLLEQGRAAIQTSIEQLVAAAIVLPGAKELVASILNAIVAPLLSRLQAEISGAAAGLFTLSGTASVVVEYHKPPDTTTSSSSTSTEPPTTLPPADFCSLYRDMKIWMNENLGALDQLAWAAEVVRRLQEMRLVAPGEMVGEVDLHLTGYSAIAAGRTGPELVIPLLPVPESILRVHAFCGMDPNEIPTPI